ELIKEIKDNAEDYGRVARIEEVAYWVGASLAAICSAIAGLSIAANASSWNEPYGKLITGALALVPAVWVALDQTIRLRQLSVFNYGVATKLSILLNQIRSAGMDDETRKMMEEYNSILATEYADFSSILSTPPDASSKKQP
ncbi:hypothetical protein, partial [Rhodoplanes sp. SY1]|uniref:hypothetical protein n=1 Tax=Rhodoplanes sp. SY1 TaxID=3166646 RepID=UPI0038B59A49